MADKLAEAKGDTLSDTLGEFEILALVDTLNDTLWSMLRPRHRSTSSLTLLAEAEA